MEGIVVRGVAQELEQKERRGETGADDDRRMVRRGKSRPHVVRVQVDVPSMAHAWGRHWLSYDAPRERGAIQAVSCPDCGPVPRTV